ncbi:hypothetical protein [Kineosporia corallincola]|uniref:hypothetical protein n=1 Tax=Kineosporia corallincola TaxID=2835133 RepID=UPI0027E15835|nr:hypothetical protein [Kineosporia corallincola]
MPRELPKELDTLEPVDESPLAAETTTFFGTAEKSLLSNDTVAATGAVRDAAEVWVLPTEVTMPPLRATAGSTAIGAVAGAADSAPLLVAACEDMPMEATRPPDIAITAPPRPIIDI